MKHKDVGFFACAYCPATFESKRKFEAHNATHDTSLQLQCPEFTGVEFALYRNFRRIKVILGQLYESLRGTKITLFDQNYLAMS